MIRVLQALSADAALVWHPGEGELRGQVHSVFARVVNIAVGGRLVALACRDVDDAPDTIVADTADFRGIGIETGEPVTACARTLTIGARLEIRLDGSRHWEPCLPHYPLDVARLRRNLSRVRAAIGADAGAARPGPSPAPSSPAHVHDGEQAVDAGLRSALALLLAERTRALCAALDRGDMDAARVRGEALVGLGPGLTPSGDDILLGLFAVLHVPGGPCEPMKGVCARIVEHAARRTNEISLAALVAAARGRVRASIHALLAAMIGGGAAAVESSLARVLAIGSTSGRDIVAGVVAGFELQLGGRVRRRARAAGLRAGPRCGPTRPASRD